jgi:hypothetical protein
MSYQRDIYEAVMASGDLVDLIGDRFSWDIADPSTATPYIVAQTISDSSETAFDGVRGVSMPLIQISCWATTKAESIAVMKKFKHDMEGVELNGSSGTSLGFSGENSSYDSASKLFGTIYDYRASVTNNE